MAFDYFLLKRARNEIRDAIEWYDARRPGLGQEFLGEVENEIDQIIEDPLIFPKFEKINTSFRRAVIKKFPFLIIFSLSEDQIIIHSVFNTYQKPNKKPSS